MAYPNEGTLVTDAREIAISETWETQTDWEAYQSASNVVISNGVVMLEDQPEIPNIVTNRWPIEEGSGSTITDAEGSSDGTFVGAPTWVSDSNYIGGHYLDFDGSDDGIDTGAPSHAGDMTVLATVVIDSDINSIQHISSWYDSGNAGERVLWFRGDTESNTVEFRVARDDGTLETVSYQLPSTGTYRIAGLLDSTTPELRLSVNGTVEATAAASGNYQTTLTNHAFAHQRTDNSRWLSAGLDDPMVADGLYSSQQLTDDYNRQPWS